LMNKIFGSTSAPLFRPSLIKSLEKARILSLSPHPDDDVIAVGGALAAHIESGGEVISVILTDGTKGTDDASGNKELRRIRMDEAKLAADILRITDLRFWNQPDGSLKPTLELSNRLAELIHFFKPEFIYLPFPIDYHFDHLAAVHLLAKSQRIYKTAAKIRCYECIVPLIPNFIVDITETIDKKRSAVRCFASQNRVSDYEHTIVEGLNRLRSHGLMRGSGYAEALFQTDSASLEAILNSFEAD
jgi:LmbE family N-acetylglucosaminyl deacetylase